VRIFAEQVQTLLRCAQVHHACATKAELLSAIMRIPADVQFAIPRYESVSPRRRLAPREIMAAVEGVVRDVLKCAKIRLFVVSSPFIGMEGGSVLYLEPDEEEVEGNATEQPNSNNRRASFLSIRASMKAGLLNSEQLRLLTGSISTAAGASGGRKLSMLQVVSDFQAQKKKDRDPSSLKTLSATYDTAGLAGYVAVNNKGVEVDGGSLPKDTPLWRQRHTKAIDLDPGPTAPIVIVPIPLARGYGLEPHYPQSVGAGTRGAPPIAVLQLVLGKEGPPFYTNDHGDEADRPLTFMQATALVQHVLSPMLTQLLACVAGDPAVPIPSKFEDKLDIPDQPNQTLGFPEKPRHKLGPAVALSGGAGHHGSHGGGHVSGSVSHRGGGAVAMLSRRQSR
jgi:hypothetical protein